MREKHNPECIWSRLTENECEYRKTHFYCPHPNHACDCPPNQEEKNCQKCRYLSDISNIKCNDIEFKCWCRCHD